MNNTPPVIEDHTVDHSDDRTAVAEIIARIETAYNTNDPELMAADCANNTSVVNAVGIRITGYNTILEANRAGLAGFLKDEYVRYDVVDITFPHPEVALAYKHARATTANGELRDHDPVMIALYVLVKQQGRWWIVARHNTPIPS